MNQNISFSSKPKEVSIFQFKLDNDFPFKYSLASKVCTLNDMGRHVEKDIYEVSVDTFRLDVCVGDFIVITDKTLYHNGITKEAINVEVHTAKSLEKNFDAYDNLEEEYLDEILEVFMNERAEDDEPTEVDLMSIEDKEIERIMQSSMNLSIDDVLEDEDEY